MTGLQKCLIGIIVLAGVTAALARPEDPKRLNVLFIISDDLRAELGSYSSRLAKTPNIDAIAAAGVRFDRAYVQVPLCNPSRASMLTGHSPLVTGVLGNRTDFRVAHPDWVTLPQLFKQNGWVTIRSGKIFHGGIDDAVSWMVGGDPGRSLLQEGESLTRLTSTESGRAGAGRSAAARASDRWIVLDGMGEGHGDYVTADRAIDYLRQYKDKPFFLAVGFVKPHSPPTAPKKFYDLWDVRSIPLPVNFAPRPTVPEGFPRASIRPRNADLFIGRDASEAEARAMIRAYLASIAWMDWNVGRVVAELDRLGLRDKTIVVFWGDNGYQLGERGKWSKAGSLFEQGARTPLIIDAPRARGNGRSSPRVVEALDVYRTLAGLCGVTAPKDVDGRSLAPLLNDPHASWDSPAFTVWSEDGKALHGVAVRTDRWRYAEFGPDGAGGAMLFDELADPDELKNLADDSKFADIRKQLSALVREYAQHRLQR